MNRIKLQWCLLTALIPILISCDTTFGGVFKNTPLGNYDYFFYELSQSYAYKDYKFVGGQTLSQIKALERNNIDGTWDSLTTALEAVMNQHIRDPHLYFKHAPVYNPPIYEDPRFETERNLPGAGGYDVYLPDSQNPDITWLDNTSQYIHYGTVASNSKVGYLYIKNLVNDVGGSERLGDKIDFGALTDKALTALYNRNVDRIIVDIRSNAGGAVYRGKQIASRFMETTNVYMITHNMTSPTAYDVVEETISPDGVDYFKGKPLILLFNNNTCSGGEMIALMIQQASGYKDTIGANTGGCTGTIIDKELPNGWIFTMTSSRTYAADGTDYFRVGIKPTIELTQTGATDNVLTRAVTEIIKY